MKKIYIFSLLLVTIGFFFSCNKSEVTIDTQLEELLNNTSKTGSFEDYIMPKSYDYASLPNQDTKNPINLAKVELGKMLFFETGIGRLPKQQVSMETYSCSSCHIPARGFTAGRFQGIADGAIGYGTAGEARVKNPSYDGSEVDAQGARPLPMLNLTYVTNALWAGTFGSFGVNVGTESVWNQDTLVAINNKGLAGLEANDHRALIVHRQQIDKQILDELGYTSLFDLAFPDVPVAERYTRQTAANAIAAYQRTILTNQAPFQLWLKGEKSAMSDQQKRGATLFFGKAGCVNCHNSPSLNNMKFFAVGVKDLYQNPGESFATGPNDKRNLGRGGFTQRPEDLYKFKVPQLYNLKDFGFYFHGASKTSIHDVVEYFNAGVPENSNVPSGQIASAFHPLGLTEQERADLVEFLENGLYDSNLQRYAPSAVMSGNCFPNNDPQSKIDMGCN